MAARKKPTVYPGPAPKPGSPQDLAEHAVDTLPAATPPPAPAPTVTQKGTGKARTPPWIVPK